MRADRLEDVLDRHGASGHGSRRDRAGVDDDGGDVEPGERHGGGWDRLVAADDGDDPVAHVGAPRQLDRVRDQLAAHERCLHPLRAHRQDVGDRDRVQLERRGPRLADAALDELGETPVVEVARHRLDPRVSDDDDRPAQVLVGQAGRAQVRAGRCAVAPVEDGAAPAAEVVRPRRRHTAGAKK